MLIFMSFMSNLFIANGIESKLFTVALFAAEQQSGIYILDRNRFKKLGICMNVELFVRQHCPNETTVRSHFKFRLGSRKHGRTKQQKLHYRW